MPGSSRLYRKTGSDLLGLVPALAGPGEPAFPWRLQLGQTWRTTIPLVRIALPKGKSPEYRQAVSAGVQQALVETFDVPKDDLFQVITEHGAGKEIVHAPRYLGIAYSDDLTLIQLTVSDTRTLEQKKKLFRRIVDHLAENPGLRREDVFINLVETKKENWSFGNGEAQYA